MKRFRRSALKIILVLTAIIFIVQGQYPQVTELTELEGHITSPGYPNEENPTGTYPDNADFKWFWNGNSSSMIQFKVWDLGIEAGEGDSNITCDFDYVSVTITSIGSRRYCGHHTPDDEIRGTGSLDVHLVSDDSVGYRGFVGSYRIVPNYDPCDPTPCGNGKCEVEELLPKCICDPGFTGEQCTEDIKECESEPCQNNGTCNETGIYNRYECVCPSEYEGAHCEHLKPEPFFCFQCGTDDNIPCGDDASPDNLKECPRDSKYCVYLKATLGGKSTIDRSCSSENITVCDRIINQTAVEILQEEPVCTAHSCEEDGCNSGCAKIIMALQDFWLGIVFHFIFFCVQNH